MLFMGPLEYGLWTNFPLVLPSMQPWARVVTNCGGDANNVIGSVKITDFLSFWGNHANSFQNLPLQTPQTECFQIWVSTLG